MLKRISVFFAAPFVASAFFSSAAFSQRSSPSNDSPASPITGLVPDHATLSVENLDVEAAWYERVLGFKVLRKMNSNPGFINQQMAIPGYRIDLIKYKGSKRPARVDPPYLQQGWIHVVFHVNSVATALRQLQMLHVQPRSVGKDDQGNPIQILLRDPENNEIEVRRNLQ
jgi:catechol 2,3-dioxygenase-like lactoylglutathione lyase family enzyme